MLSSAVTWMDLKDIKLSETSDREKTNTVYHLHMESK